MRLHPDNGSPGSGDQAERLRQLRRSETSPRLSLDQNLRVVLLSELPNSACGARFAFHLVNALGQLDPASPGQSNLLLDLAPAASRLPAMLADKLPEHSYESIWHELAAGNEFVPCHLRSIQSLAIAAAPQACSLDCEQQARVYEDLLRQLRQQASQWKWIVILAVDHALPIDRSYWLTADEIVLLNSDRQAARQQHLAAFQSRQLDCQMPHRMWTLVKQASRWQWPSRTPSRLAHQPDPRVATQALPSIHWTDCHRAQGLRSGSRADARLARRAGEIAYALFQSAGCQAAHINSDYAAAPKKIQLPSLSRSIQREPGIVRA